MENNIIFTFKTVCAAISGFGATWNIQWYNLHHWLFCYY